MRLHVLSDCGYGGSRVLKNSGICFLFDRAKLNRMLESRTQYIFYFMVVDEELKHTNSEVSVSLFY
jgi:hypothetical protein